MRQPVVEALGPVALAAIAVCATPAGAQDGKDDVVVLHPARTSPTCWPAPILTFFNRESSTVTPEAAVVLDLAAQEYLADCRGARVMVAGYVDRALSEPRSEALSEAMARSVAAGLIARGVPAILISSAGFGETRPRIATPDGVWELQNRRVEITFEP